MERGSLVGVPCSLQLAAVRFDDGSTDRKTYAQSSDLRGEEGFKQLVFISCPKPRSCVGYGYRDSSFTSTRRAEISR